MRLARGSFIGHYEVLQLMGAGGMGEVYRARDTKLHRDVALKILPDAFAADSSRRSRLRREATTLASLNHPHIAQIHGVEESGATLALVMELVEGDDLARRLTRGPIPVVETLAIARQITEALEAAHEAGIIHRDLKPANIKVRPDGTVKVLDFGLAKLIDPAAGNPGDSPTLDSLDLTDAGAVLGTAAYMAPEQAKGLSIDRRADIWAFGCVLYEMLAGTPCFRGDSAAEVLAAVLTREPDWRALPDTTTEILRRVLVHCLQKDPKNRLHDIADARIDLVDAIVAPPQAATPSGRRSTITSRWALWAGIALLGALAVALLKSGRSPEAAYREIRVHRLTDFVGLEETPAFSLDSKSVAFSASVGDKRHIFVQLTAGGVPLRITTDPVDHLFPRWSPDSGSIVYFSPAAAGHSQGAIWEISSLGGSARRIIDSVGAADVSVVDGRLAVFRLAEKAIDLVAVHLDGSNLQVVRKFDADKYYLYPRWSPDGKWIAFQRGDSVRFDLFVVPAGGGEPRQVTHENSMKDGFAWLPDSTGILYSSSRGQTMPYLPTSGLWLVTLRDGISRQISSGETSYLYPDIARDGSVAAGRMRLQTDIWKFPVDGAADDNTRRAVRLTHQTGQVLTPTAGPGDKEVAFLSDSGGHANLWVINVESGAMRQITDESNPEVSVGVPVWSPDGSSIAFVSTRDNPGLKFGIWLVNPDGSNLRRVVNPALGLAWSHDGRWLYYSTRGDDAGADVELRKIPVEGGRAQTVTVERVRNVIGSDGSTLYYVMERPLVDGTPEFEIRAASPENAPFRVLARISPSLVPIWQIFNPSLAPDGKSLAQALTDGFTTNIWVISTSTGEWRQITDFAGRPTFIARRVSWSSDGRSVLAAVAEGDSDIVLFDGLLDGVRR